jgi:hypothetical protein
VIRTNGECATLEVWLPMAHRLDQANEVILVCRQLGWCGETTRLKKATMPLMLDNAKPNTRLVVVHNEAW